MSGQGVKTDQQRRLAGIGVTSRTIGGYRVVVRARGIDVEQGLRKSETESRRRPRFAALQKSELFEAAAENEQDTRERVEHALDAVVRIFD